LSLVNWLKKNIFKWQLSLGAILGAILGMQHWAANLGDKPLKASAGALFPRF